jgi:hypothetical protein
MSYDIDTKEKINRIRDLLDRLIDNNDTNITSQDILGISMTLDELILEYIKNYELQ